MRERSWTTEQSQAIQSRGGTLLVSAAAGSGIMRDHGINVSGAHHKTETRLTEPGKIAIGFPVRLGKHRYAVPPALKQTGNNRRPKGRMIHISITCHQNKVRTIPAQSLRFFFYNRQKWHDSSPLCTRFGQSPASLAASEIKQIRRSSAAFHRRSLPLFFRRSGLRRLRDGEECASIRRKPLPRCRAAQTGGAASPQSISA